MNGNQLTLRDVSKVNRQRCDRWHSGSEPWSSSDWTNALAGEVGELCNVVKKIRCHESGAGTGYNTPDMTTLLASVKDEIADVYLYLDLVAYHFGLALKECIVPKFDRVSEAQGFPERLGRADQTA